MKHLFGYVITIVGLVGLLGSFFLVTFGGGKLRRWWFCFKNGVSLEKPLLVPGIIYTACGLVGFLIAWVIFAYGRGSIP